MLPNSLKVTNKIYKILVFFVYDQTNSVFLTFSQLNHEFLPLENRTCALASEFMITTNSETW